MEKDLQDFLDKNYPLNKSDEYFKMLYSDIETGKQIYKTEMEYRRKEASSIFIAGYLAAFKEGNVSPNSYFLVISNEKLMNLNSPWFITPKDGEKLEDLIDPEEMSRRFDEVVELTKQWANEEPLKLDED